ERIDPGQEIGASFSVAASATKLSTVSSAATATAGFAPSADATVVSSAVSWGPVSASSSTTGLSSLRRAIQTDIDPTFPFTYAETPEGDILMANGVDPMLKWRWLRDSAEPAGIDPPTTKPTIAASGE